MKNSITIKKNVKIINNEYVIKKKKSNLDNTFNYLSSRSFDNFPKILKEDEEFLYYEYINDINEPKEQKIIDLILLLSLLHNKTTFYKEVDLDYYKYIYESLNNQIDDVYNYYNNIMDNIEQTIYMSPSNYLIARNISAIYNSLNYAKNHTKKWYQQIEDKRKVRMSTIHNNLSLDHYLKSDKPYFISWDKSVTDIPIYDLVTLYKNHYLDFEFIDLFKIYFSKYHLTNDEMNLFLILIAIPDKIKKANSEYKTVLNVRRIIDYVYKTNAILKEYRIKQEPDKN